MMVLMPVICWKIASPRPCYEGWPDVGRHELRVADSSPFLFLLRAPYLLHLLKLKIYFLRASRAAQHGTGLLQLSSIEEPARALRQREHTYPENEGRYQR